ncbi:MAG: hypothetical protein AAF862_01615 [Pseudomonadota bacterium]
MADDNASQNAAGKPNRPTAGKPVAGDAAGKPPAGQSVPKATTPKTPTPPAKPAATTKSVPKAAGIPASKPKPTKAEKPPAKPAGPTAQSKENAPATAAEPSKPPKQSSSSGLAWTLVVLLLAFIGGVAATPYALPPLIPLLPEPVKGYFAPLLASAQGESADVAAQLVQLETAVRKAEQSARREAGSAVASLEGELNALSAQVMTLEAALQSQAQTNGRLQSILEAVPTDEASGGVSAAVVANLQAELSDAQTTRTALSQGLDAVRAQLAALTDRQSSAAGSTQLSETAAALRERISAVEARLASVAERASTAAAPEALDEVARAMEQAMTGFESRLKTLENIRQQSTAAMVAGLESARLAQAVANGRAYAAELTALAELKARAGSTMPDIADLLADIEPFARSGIPSGAALSAQLEARSREILTAIDTPQGADWWQRLLARVRNLVTVRKLGSDAQSSDPPDVLARAETAARFGDWAAVVAEVESLPEAAKDSLGSWWDAAQARATAQRVLAELSARLGLASTDAQASSQAEAAP